MINLDHPTILLFSVFLTIILVTGQLFYGFFTSGSNISRDLAIGTFLYTLLSVYYLFEPDLPRIAGVISVPLMAFNIFFIYMAIREAFFIKPSSRLDLYVLLLSLPIGVAAVLLLDFRYQIIFFSVFVMFFFMKSGYIGYRLRERISPGILIAMFSFILAYPALFAFQTVRFLVTGVPGHLYTQIAGNVMTSTVALLLLAMFNAGVLILASVRNEERIQKLLDESKEEEGFAKDMLKIVGHDIRNQISYIDGHASLLPESQASVRDHIRDDSRKAVEILTDLLYWGRSRTGLTDSMPDYIAVEDLLSAVISDLHSTIRQKDLHINLPADRTIIRIDIVAARVVLRNILGNAGKFAPRGSTVSITTSASGDHLSVTIRDKGRGIEPQLLDELKKGRYVPSESGSGSGLNIVTAICRAYEWKLDIDSSPGEGTALTVRFPAGINS